MYLLSSAVCRLNCSSRVHHTDSSHWTSLSSSLMDTMTADVIAPSPWTIFGCENGKIKFLIISTICNFDLMVVFLQVCGYFKKPKIGGNIAGRLIVVHFFI